MDKKILKTETGLAKDAKAGKSLGKDGGFYNEILKRELAMLTESGEYFDYDEASADELERAANTDPATPYHSTADYTMIPPNSEESLADTSKS